jgi:prepilin-type N-terminal cleavage/methylation domain-containing protein
MEKNKKKAGLSLKRGLTLVELLIVLAIAGIMLSVALINIQNSRKNSEIEAAGMQLVSLLREVQNNALTGKKIGSAEGEYSCAFQLTIDTDGSYEIARSLKQPGEDSCEDEGVMDDAYITGELQKVQISSSQTIKFSVPHGDITGISMITLQHVADPSVTYTACISSGGNIEGVKGGSCPE